MDRLTPEQRTHVLDALRGGWGRPVAARIATTATEATVTVDMIAAEADTDPEFADALREAEQHAARREAAATNYADLRHAAAAGDRHAARLLRLHWPDAPADQRHPRD